MPRVRSIAPPIAALGIVFGDIGTSPLYSINQLVLRSGAVKNAESVTGAISLVIWILTIVICFKYVSVVLRADNDRQGGVFALLALLHGHKSRVVVVLSALLVFAAGMLFGDGVITPAISVLSAVEGLKVATPEFRHYTVPLTLVVLTILFVFQAQGTEKVAKLFGPIMALWFAYLAALGLHSILQEPHILRALNPLHALRFLVHLDLRALTLAMGSVVLVVTGGEALFADLGHLGKRPIRQAWLALVYPALILNYLGQGAHVLHVRPTSPEYNIFYSMVPHMLLYPTVLLATVATVIASQALISGAFSLVAQGIALKYLPTMKIVHTHDEHEGQTYIPFINWALFLGSVFLVVTFRSSDKLAHAYGLAVSADMVITTLAVTAVARLHWRWSRWAVLAVFGTFFIVDGSLFLGNVPKIPSGGYVPLCIGAVMVWVMTTWKWGRQQVSKAFRQYSTMTMAQMVEIKSEAVVPFPRPTVLLTSHSPTELEELAPPLLELFYKRFGGLPRQLVLLSIRQKRVPYMTSEERYEVVEFQNDPEGGGSLLSISANFGFRENPDVEDVIRAITAHHRLDEEDPGEWMIHAGRERVVGAHDGRLWRRLRYGLFKTLSSQAEPSYGYFGMDDDTRLTVEFVPVVL